MTRTRLAVLGSPISHSRSPALHRAAYRALGLPWTYEAIEVTDADLPQFLAERDDSWRGLSLTMPLKNVVVPALTTCTDLVRRTGAANTIAFTDTGLHGDNTDVGGMVRVLEGLGLGVFARATLVGAGATAASVLCAFHAVGVREVTVFVRDPARANGLTALADTLGIAARVERLPALAALTPEAAGGVVVSCLPGGTDMGMFAPRQVRAAVPLIDVAYAPWPTALAATWQDADGRAISGLELLVQQALLQVRIFAGAGVDDGLPDEPAILAVMRAAGGA